MPIILTNEGSVPLLDALRAAFLDGLGIALFKNDIIPTRLSVLADFTEAAFPGYAPQSISIPGPAFLNAQQYAQVDGNMLTFSSTGASAETIYGYILYDTTPTVILAERFAAPVPFLAAGSSVDIGIKITDVSQFNG
jgi:hypothetical protein